MSNAEPISEQERDEEGPATTKPTRVMQKPKEIRAGAGNQQDPSAPLTGDGPPGRIIDG